MNGSTLATLVDGVLGLAVIAGGIILLAVGRVDSTTGVSLIAAGAAIAKGATTAALALKVPPPPEQP